MENHLLDIIEEKIEEGVGEKEAIYQMGDPIVTSDLPIRSGRHNSKCI